MHALAARLCSNLCVKSANVIQSWAFALVLSVTSILCQGQSPSATGETALPSAPSESIDAKYAEARRLLQQGKNAEAISNLEKIGTENPGLKGLSHELGAAYYKSGDYMKAIDALGKALHEDPNDKEALQLRGLSYYLSGRPGEAIPLLEQVQGWYTRANVDASYILGVCYIQTKNYPQARVAFSRMFEVKPDSAAAYLVTARVLLRQEFDPIAEEYAKKAIEIDPKLPLAHFFLGELHTYKSKIPEAIADFQGELALNPGHAATYWKLADAYSRVGKFDEAERLLQRSIWLDAASTGPYILLGKVLEKKGESELAVRALQHALTMDPNNAVTHHLLGQAYIDMGRTEDAERERKAAQQLQDVKNDSEK